jgi:hypothetical protein
MPFEALKRFFGKFLTNIGQFVDFQMNLWVGFNKLKTLFGTSECSSKHFFNIIEPTIIVNEMFFQIYWLSSSWFFNV